MPANANFKGGRNIAMKTPPHQFDATVAFYRDTLGLQQIESLKPDIVFQFGSNQLWIDNVPGMSQAEIWLEVIAEDAHAAAEHLEANGVVRCDAIEPLPENMSAFWISSPAQIIHLVCEDD